VACGRAAATPDAAATHLDLRVRLMGHPSGCLLRLPLQATRDDLHHPIQAAFAWDDEHLYELGFGRTPERPEGRCGPSNLAGGSIGAVTLGQLRLERGRRFWDTFEFGAMRRFSLTVVAASAPDRRQRVLQFHGEAPEQDPDPGFP